MSSGHVSRARRSISSGVPQKTNLSTDSTIKQNESNDEEARTLFDDFTRTLFDAGKILWDKFVGPAASTEPNEMKPLPKSPDLDHTSSSKHTNDPEYFLSPIKVRKVVPIEAEREDEILGDVIHSISKGNETNKNDVLSFSKDPFRWNDWKTTEINQEDDELSETNKMYQPPQYGTSFVRKNKLARQNSNNNQLVLRNQSEEVEYLKMIFKGEYKVPKIIEDEREEQLMLMQRDRAKNNRLKGISDLTEKIKNILLEKANDRKTKDEDLIFVREQKIKPLGENTRNFYHQRLLFDRSILEFDKESKTYKQLLEERKQIQDEVRKKKERTKDKRLVPKMSEGEINKVKQTLNRQDNAVLLNKDNIEVSVRDFKTLTPRRWLNDTIIEFFMKLIEKKTSKTVAFNSFFYTNLSERGYQGVRRWMKKKKTEIGELDKIFVPVNLNQSHWALGMIDVPRKRIIYVDSLSNGPNAMSFAILSDLQNYVIDESKAALGSDFELENLNCPQQPNGFDCGIYLCMNTLYLSHDAPLTFDHNDAVRMRTYIAHLILSER